MLAIIFPITAHHVTVTFHITPFSVYKIAHSVSTVIIMSAKNVFKIVQLVIIQMVMYA